MALKINLHCLSFWSFIQIFLQILTFHWSKTMESAGKISLWNKCFSLVHISHNYWHPIIAMLFSQDNSSEFSPIMPDEVREHLTRDQRPFLHPESPHILQIHSSMTVLLLFSSPHSFFTGFRSGNWDSHSKILILCSVTHFCVDFDVCFGSLSWWKIQTWSIIRFLTEAVRFRFLYLLVFDWIHDAMHLTEKQVTL